MLQIPEGDPKSFTKRAEHAHEFKITVGAFQALAKQTVRLQSLTGRLKHDWPFARPLSVPAGAHKERATVWLQGCACREAGLNLAVQIRHQLTKLPSSIDFVSRRIQRPPEHRRSILLIW